MMGQLLLHGFLSSGDQGKCACSGEDHDCQPQSNVGFVTGGGCIVRGDNAEVCSLGGGTGAAVQGHGVCTVGKLVEEV